jgi:preprotein translocase subunit YajC
MISSFILAQDAAENTAPAWVGPLFYVVIFAAIFYFLILRPQRTRASRHRELMRSLEVGDEIRTAGGIYGFVRTLDDESAVIEVEDGTRLRIARGAIATKIAIVTEE